MCSSAAEGIDRFKDGCEFWLVRVRPERVWRSGDTEREDTEGVAAPAGAVKGGCRLAGDSPPANDAPGSKGTRDVEGTRRMNGGEPARVDGVCCPFPPRSLADLIRDPTSITNLHTGAASGKAAVEM